ncbi:uncharacterized protein LOC117109693 [Anneissia japonica]|uniref:uncharacterized protein LOC117109693 n=1 Tax=Anneissia japonica TaxID=1529436 RepID=UPI0014259ECB|nr:uncharacterized protein LOC117109693 [Anneissia japonica]XP_033107962.1 uncharacterized protein LOC117109693 [Anneissia japonica]
MSVHLYPRYETYTCHLCHSKEDICKKFAAKFHLLLNTSKYFLPSGKLTRSGEQQLKQLELIHDLHPQLRQLTKEFRIKFQKWSKCRLQVIEELSKFINQVANMKLCTNVVKASGQIGGIIGGILAIGGVILAPETGGLSLTALGIRVSFSSAVFKWGANVVDGVFTTLQSKRVVSLIKRDQELTKEMAEVAESLMTTSKVFSQAVDEFESRNQIFGAEELITELKQIKSERDQMQTALEGVAKAMKTGLLDASKSPALRALSGVLIGIYVLVESVQLIQTITDINDGSKSQLQEEIMTLTAVMVREHDILKKQYDSM